MNASLQVVPIDRLSFAPQVRKHFDQAAIDGLAASIRESGLQQPPLVRREGDLFIGIDGERRVRACQSLGMNEIPVLVVDDPLTVTDILIRQLACNLQREDLNPVEQAESFHLLMERGKLTADRVASTLGKSSGTVSRALKVLQLPPPILAQVASGQIPADTAYLLARVETPERQAALAAEVVGGKLTRDALTRKMKRVRRAEAHAKDGPNRVTALLGGGRSITVGGKGLTLDSLMEALEQLLARARKSKSQGLTLATFVRTLRDQAAQ